MRSRRIDVLEISKQKDTKQPNKGKINAPPVHILSKTDPNPNNPIIKNISDKQPPNRQSSTAIPAKGKAEEPLELDLEAISAHEEEKNA